MVRHSNLTVRHSNNNHNRLMVHLNNNNNKEDSVRKVDHAIEHNLKQIYVDVKCLGGAPSGSYGPPQQSGGGFGKMKL